MPMNDGDMHATVKVDWSAVVFDAPVAFTAVK